MYKDRIIKEIKELKERLDVSKDSPLAIQLPEGLKQYSTEILDNFKEFKPILFVDPTFGACDLRDKEAKLFGCKSLVHFGHTGMGKQKINTYFIPISYLFSDIEIDYIISEIKKLNSNKINLVTTINFIENIPKIKNILKKSNIEVLESRETSHIKPHMLLGCDSSAIVNSENTIVYIGDGVFHPNNLGFVFSKIDIHIINPITKESKILEINDRFTRQRYGLIAKAREASVFGILVSSKQGQFRLRLAYNIKERLEALGKKAYIFASDYVKEEYVLGMKIDCYVNTGCPRITYDDFSSFKKPIITAQEVSLLENINNELKIDQIRGLEEYF